MFKATLINLALRLLDKYLVGKIRLQELRDYVKNLFDELKKVAELLTDKNPNNLEQLRDFWKDNKNNLVQESLPTAISIIEKEIKDELARDLIIELILAYQEEQLTKTTRRIVV